MRIFRDDSYLHLLFAGSDEASLGVHTRASSLLAMLDGGWPRDRLVPEVVGFVNEVRERASLKIPYRLDWIETRPFIEPCTGFRIT